MTFRDHMGDCQQCREVLEAFFAEMPQPHLLCDTGREILERLINKPDHTDLEIQKSNEREN